MEKTVRRVRFEDSQRLDVEYWATKSPQERFDALKVIMARVIKIHPLFANVDEYFKKFIKKLNANSTVRRAVEYLVIGGHAVIRHGYVRATGDIDVWVNPTEENAERVIRALVQFGYSPYDFEISDFTHPDSSVSLGNALFKIDIR